MKVYRSLEEYEAGESTVATIGTFDGVHVGHKKILERVNKRAQEIGGESVLISFHPHPRLVLFPENNPLRLLQSLNEKISLLRECGLDKLLLIPFTKEFSRLPSKAFIKDMLVDKICIHTIVIGYDHRFGKNRTGGIEELEELGPEYGFAVEEIPAQAIDDANVSSTKIRRALQEGDMKSANTFLGYTYPISGEVIHGEKQGRKLGYPTANIKAEDSLKLIPKDGIYFVRVEVQNKRYYGMLSIGVKPTMGEFDRGLEVYIFDFNENIYGQRITVELLEYLRGEKKFDSLEALIEAMDADKARSLKLIDSYGTL